MSLVTLILSLTSGNNCDLYFQRGSGPVSIVFVFLFRKFEGCVAKIYNYP